MQSPSLWRSIQRQNFTDYKRLLCFLELEPPDAPWLGEIAHFPLNLPLRIAQKIEKGNWRDPLLIQFLPTARELDKNPLYSLDPVEDKNARKTAKLLRKYEGRALLVSTGACAMNCRFCFRQHFEYEREEKSFEKELQAISRDTSLTEIILSGGDPLSLSDNTLSALIEKLSMISHLKRLRFHTRFPIGIPERLDEGFLSILRNTRLQTYFVIHCNHPRELDADILTALKKIQHLGGVVLCQSVLLKAVNDELTTLRTLFETLIDAGILPYYLHQLDRVQGAQHFEVPIEKGLSLMRSLRALLPGYALPAYVSEIPQEPSKSVLGVGQEASTNFCV